MAIFTETQELVALSMRMMRILAVGYVAMAVTQSLWRNARRGDTMGPMWISLITTVFLRVPIAYGIAYLTRSEAYPTGRLNQSSFRSGILDHRRSDYRPLFPERYLEEQGTH